MIGSKSTLDRRRGKIIGERSCLDSLLPSVPLFLILCRVVGSVKSAEWSSAMSGVILDSKRRRARLTDLLANPGGEEGGRRMTLSLARWTV